MDREKNARKQSEFACCDNLGGYDHEHVQTSGEGAGFSRDGAGDFAFLGGEPRFPEAAGEKCGRAAVVVSGWADHGEQPDGGTPRVGPLAEGYVPAVQRDARVRATIPERVRLPGTVGRGRGGKEPRAGDKAGDSRVRDREVCT